MPKTKTHSASKKRFRVTAGGKVLRRKGIKSHILEKKSSKRKRGFRKMEGVSDKRHPRDPQAPRQALSRRVRRGARTLHSFLRRPAIDTKE